MVRLHAKPVHSRRGESHALAEPRATCARRGRGGSSRFLSRAILAAWCAAFLLGSLQARSLDPATPLNDLSTQAWVLENGMPQNSVQALAQTPDGFVWAGTEAGLARFDGSGFLVFDHNSTPALPAGDIHCLLAASDDSLWIGTSEGIARLKDGAVTVLTTRNGLPSNDIRAIKADSRGGIIVSTAGGEVGIEGLQIGPLEMDMLTTPDSASNIVFTAKLADGSTAQATRSTVSVLEAGRDLRFSVGKQLPGTRIQALLADGQGSLWIGTNGGLARLAGDKLQLFTPGAPLASASVLALLEDREGNLWVGTETQGLHILRNRRFFTFDSREGLISDATTTVVEDGTGMLWIGTSGSGLNAVPLRKGGFGTDAFPARGAIQTYTVRTGLASNVILSMAVAPDGDLWVGTPDGLNRIHRGQIETFTSADGLPDDFIRSLLVDTDGSLWVGTRHGLAHWTGQAGAHPRIETLTQVNGLGSDLVGAMARDAHGDLWVATLAGLSRLHAGKIANFTVANGLSSNVVTALSPQPDGTLLIGTENHGLDRWSGGRFSALPDDSLERTTVHAILDDGMGHLWFATGNGIARCGWNRPAAGAWATCSRWMEFGTADGLRTRQMAANSHPSAWRSRDGRLWFATPKGLVEVDPPHFQLNTLAPSVVLEHFTVDGADEPLHSSSSNLKVAPGRVHFEFEYAGLSFVAPQKVRYRYMLQGFDRGWTYAGARRSAYYTNIPPGDYTFRVEAANNDGLWNNSGAEIAFTLRRHFYRTLWFYALVLALLIASILLFLRRRLQLAEHEFRAVLGERNRIAREIHDTLAQGYVGISVQLELLAELLRLKKIEDASKQLNMTREYVREGLADARQSIWALRTQDSGEETLPVKLGRMVEQAGSSELTSRLRVRGAYRPLPAATERELLRVAQEAIHNVKKHAQATDLSVTLEYGQETMLLEIQDNGRGGAIQPVPGSGVGHFGVTGMRERAEAIGGTLEIESAPGKGTIIRLRASALTEMREHAGEPK